MRLRSYSVKPDDMGTDFKYLYDGSLVLLFPVTERAVAWIDANLQYESYQRIGTGLLIDLRMFLAIGDNIIASGLTIERQ